MEVRFSVGKLAGDVARMLFLPLWIVLALPYLCIRSTKTMLGKTWRRVYDYGFDTGRARVESSDESIASAVISEEVELDGT